MKKIWTLWVIALAFVLTLFIIMVFRCERDAINSCYGVVPFFSGNLIATIFLILSISFISLLILNQLGIIKLSKKLLLEMRSREAVFLSIIMFLISFLLLTGRI